MNRRPRKKYKKERLGPKIVPTTAAYVMGAHSAAGPPGFIFCKYPMKIEGGNRYFAIRMAFLMKKSDFQLHLFSFEPLFGKTYWKLKKDIYYILNL